MLHYYFDRNFSFVSYCKYIHYMTQNLSPAKLLFALLVVLVPVRVVCAVENDPFLNRVFVQYHEGVSKNSRAFADSQVGLRKALDNEFGVVSRFRSILPGKVELLELDGLESSRMSSVLTMLKKDPSIKSVTPDFRMHLQRVPNDLNHGMQWHLNSASDLGSINVHAAWDVALPNGFGASTMAQVRVGVVDTGIVRHEDLNANILPGYDFISNTAVSRDGDGEDPDPTDEGDWMAAGACGGGQPLQASPSTWHGTVVSGLIAAAVNNGRGVAGVAPNAKIVPIRVAGACGASSADIILGMSWAAGLPLSGGTPPIAQPVDVLNVSLGSVQPNCPQPLQDILTNIQSAGVTIVTSSGNTNSDAISFFPANCDGVVVVGAVTRSGSKAFYSNTGKPVDVMGPGGDSRTLQRAEDGLLSTYNTGVQTAGFDDYVIGHMGTSFAAAHVSGIAALLLGMDTSLTPVAVENIIKTSTKSIAGACSGCGSGIVDATSAVNQLVVAPGGPNVGVGSGGGPETTTVSAVDVWALLVLLLIFVMTYTNSRKKHRTLLRFE